MPATGWMIAPALCLAAGLCLPNLVQAEVRIGVETRMAALPLLVAQERGYFERQGVDVELQVLDEDEDAVDLLDAGELQLLTLAGPPLLELRNIGFDISGIVVLGTSLNSEAVLADDTITDVRQLRGEPVAMQAGSASELVLAAALGRKGLSLNDVDAVEATPRKAIELLLAGEVKAAASAAPWLPQEQQGQSPRTLVSTADQPGLIHDLLAGSTPWLEAHRNEMKAVIAAWHDALLYLRRRPAAAHQIIADALELTPSVIASGFGSITLHDVDENMQLLRGDFQQQFAQMGDVLQDNRDNRSASFTDANRVLLLSPLRQVAARR